MKDKGEYKWIKHVQNSFNQVGISDIWISQNVSSILLLIHHVKLRQSDAYLQQWNSQLASSSRLKIYTIFKEYLTKEKYLIKSPQITWTTLLKSRTSNHYSIRNRMVEQ